MIGALVLGLLGLLAISAPLIAPFDPTEQHLQNRLQPPGFVDSRGRSHLAGTDQFGRDVFSRLLYGGRAPLVVAFSAAFIGALVGLLIGLPAGYFGGVVDVVLASLIDVQLSMPFILLALAVVALFGPSTTNIILVFALTSWGVNARVARASAIGLRSSPFVEASRSVGAGQWRILVLHVLPNALPQTIVVASVQVALFVIVEAAFGFFGLGVPPPTPTWGNMLADARGYVYQAWWLGTFPGLGIMLTALAANLLGDGLRDVLDPYQARAIREAG